MSEHTLREKWLFLSKYLRFPDQIGSITPSSGFLARRMVSLVPWEQVQTAAELGAGTGAITRYISSSSREGSTLLLFEKDPDLRGRLKRQYPDAICCPDAFRIGEELTSRKIQKLDAIVSGLPFFNFPSERREQLLEEIDHALKPGGPFIAFQYSTQMKARLQRRFELESIQFVPWNFPPAFIYVCRKK